MPWWAWMLIGWAVVATTAAVWWGKALSNADLQDEVRRIGEASGSDWSSPTDAPPLADSPSAPVPVARHRRLSKN